MFCACSLESDGEGGGGQAVCIGPLRVSDVLRGCAVLPSAGWIHAVLTSQDCMAFGGNFLHNLNIGMQLR